jgi:cytidyltransferase-like protein
MVTGPFDDLRSIDLRFLQEVSRLGPVTVLLWEDEAIRCQTGRQPRFPLAERLYFLNALRYVTKVIPTAAPGSPGFLATLNVACPGVWVDRASDTNIVQERFSRELGLEYRILSSDQLNGFPPFTPDLSSADRKKVVVTGCYDWLHSGHARFFEEVSAYGNLYVVVGNDANIRLLKGTGHPLLPQEERRFLTGSIRWVAESLIASGSGWLDADPEIQRLKPDIYAVNEDGDRGGKREYCAERRIEYIVLKRTPAPGLAKRSSTDLRGF